MWHSKLFCIWVLTFFVISSSFAETVEWSSVAMACVPISNTVEEGKYVTTAGRVKFKDRKSGLISFICPVTQELRSGEYTLKGHTTGFGLPTIVLRQSEKDNYSVINMLNADIYFGVPGNKYGTQHSGTHKQLNFDSKRFYYWVQITIKKSNNADTGVPTAIHGVELIRK